MVVELCKSFTNYGPNKHRNYNWTINYLQITTFYDPKTSTMHKRVVTVTLEMNLGYIYCSVQSTIPSVTKGAATKQLRFFHRIQLMISKSMVLLAIWI